MPKQTRLDEKAMIYQPRNELTEKEKLRDMPMNKRLSYLWEYYRLYALAAVIVIALLSYAIYGFTHPRASTQFYAAMINNTIPDDVLAKCSDDFSQQLKLDPKRETVFLNTNFNYNLDSTYTVNMRDALVTYVAANEVDVIIAPESIFQSYAYNGFFSKLSDKLPTDIYSTLTDQFYLSNTDEDTDQYAYGIYLTGTKLYKENAVNTDPYVLGIVANSKHEGNTVEFIRYLFGQ